MDLCLLLLLVLLHSLCQCDLPHWLLFRLRGLLRPLGLALWVKKASILSPLLKSTTQQRLSVQALHTLALSTLLPHSSSLTERPGLCLPKQTDGCGRCVQKLSLEIALQPKINPCYLKNSLLCSAFIIITLVMSFHTQSNKMFSLLLPSHSPFQVPYVLWCVLFLNSFFF